ncbi:type II RES/Xre toxin-antitoxin system antitoxin [Halofilum ochraceum]|uniref:type II RES/Xre toxin-antitoxin system antitoxin n=1 Tax=Halofilum ochraceum TaxID=1611323 RepID=UPI0008314495|nr:antitoxin Xre/MbcA/ParS toxin-binding domain-containing protein [Halofilum ochraceum]
MTSSESGSVENSTQREREQWLAFYLGTDDSTPRKGPKAPQVRVRWSSMKGASLAAFVEAGLSVDTAESLRQRTHMTVKGFGRFIPRSTLQSKRKSDQRLSTEQSDRIMRIAEVYAHAATVFGDSDRAERWMKRTNPQMPDERTPEEMLEHSYGARLVDEVLTQLEHGVPA